MCSFFVVHIQTFSPIQTCDSHSLRLVMGATHLFVACHPFGFPRCCRWNPWRQTRGLWATAMVNASVWSRFGVENLQITWFEKGGKSSSKVPFFLAGLDFTFQNCKGAMAIIDALSRVEVEAWNLLQVSGVEGHNCSFCTTSEPMEKWRLGQEDWAAVQASGSRDEKAWTRRSEGHCFFVRFFPP